MPTQFEPPPTHSQVVLFDDKSKDVEQLLRSAKFSPIWLKWFLDVAALITASGGGGGGGLDHNMLSNLQGGIANEYYHLTNGEHSALTAGFTGTGALVRAGSPSLTTPNIGAATASSVNFGASALANFRTWTNFTPTVTLSGAGTVPQYTTNEGRWMQIGKIAFVEYYLTGDGGNEGAGVVAIRLALPANVGASATTSASKFAGIALNNATIYQLFANLAPNDTYVQLSYFSAINNINSFLADDQNNATRAIKVSIWYEVD